MSASKNTFLISILKRLPLLVALAVSVIVFWWLLSQSTWSLIGAGWRGDSFDSLARSLLKGQADVEPERIGVEAFTVNGRIFMYFGPLPALLRLPFVIAKSPWVNSLSPLSCFVACVLSVAAFCTLCMPWARRNPFMAAWTLLGFALGSPLFFLGMSTSIYHEAILWGLAGALWSVTSLIFLLSSERQKIQWLTLCSIAAGLTLLARITFGFPAYLCVASGFFLSIRGDRRKIVRACLAVLPAVTAVLVQMLYNYMRFDSVFITAPYGPNVSSVDPAIHGGWSNWRRLPEIFSLYFIPTPQYFLSSFPFVRMVMPEYGDPSLFFPWKEPVAPLTVTTPWLITFAVAGAIAVIRRRALEVVLIGALLIGCWYPVLTLFSTTERYVAEFIPALVFIAVMGLRGERTWMRSTISKLVSICLILLSIASTILSASGWPPQVAGAPFVSGNIEAIMAGTRPIIDWSAE